MKNKYGIGFFAVTIIAVLMITCAYQFTFQKAKERAQAEQKTEEEERKETGAEEESVTADGAALKEDCYYLMEVNGYVVVYLSDRTTAYEYTDIRAASFCAGRSAKRQICRRRGPALWVSGKLFQLKT